MDQSIVNKFKFDWSGLDEFIYDLNLTNYVGRSNKFTYVELPEFVPKYGIKNNQLLFPEKYVEPHNYESIVKDFTKCNWIGAAYHLVTLSHENRNFKDSILSKSEKTLPNEIFEKALVNRYLLFIRDLAAFKNGNEELMGVTAKPKIILTHDIDAIKATLSLKVRQYFQNRSWPEISLGTSLDLIKEIVDLEKKAEAKSIFFVSGNKRLNTLPIFDPKYQQKELSNSIDYIYENGFDLGLHPGIFSSFSYRLLKSELNKLKTLKVGQEFKIRNHWLSNFGNKTWQNYSRLGFSSDYSIGFNDRPGMRNSSLISFSPFKNLELIPMIVMDGQFFNYKNTDQGDIIKSIEPYINEIQNVGGIASINFHQRFFHSYYDYKSVYENLLEYLNEKDLL